MLISLLAAAFAAIAPADTAQDVRYGYCMASEPDYGRYHLFSTVFRVPDGTYHVGVQNSFHSFAEAYDGRRFGAVSCGVTFSTWQQAEDDKNQWIARKRNLGHGVSLANWSYHGG
jgi:hypothetical protein